MSAAARALVLHYTGYDDDRGGIVSIVRALNSAGEFDCVLGVNTGARQQRTPPLPQLELPPVRGETIGLADLWRARAVARAVRVWLRADSRRIFHGHSRAGLLVALWLQRWGEKRCVASVHCYGRRRWFYRWAARTLETKLFWLSPAMRAYYGIGGIQWEQCIPGAAAPMHVVRSPAPPGRLRLGGIGSLVPWKGWDTVIEALGCLAPADRARVSFTHIGAGAVDYTTELRQLAQSRGVSAQVNFCGEESSPERLLGEIDLLVIASRNEPFSVAMLEALQAGVPVLAADSGGAKDVVRDGVNGALYPTGDTAALAVRLRGWLENPPAWEPASVRDSAPRLDVIAAQWRQVYERL
ncbi:MAG TPA: glycosyltransferase family 4 protein [Candidatus Didemnitutus sp.]|nr:glycosyltransferase family 4 protein [Candidatus Didemnitutus sp.]